jgi:hypothetical protein
MPRESEEDASRGSRYVGSVPGVPSSDFQALLKEVTSTFLGTL